MAKTYMNDEDKDDIAAAIAAHRYDPEKAKLIAEGIILAQKLYDRKYDADQRTFIDSLADGVLPEDDDIRVACGGQQFDVPFSGRYQSYGSETKVFKRVFSRDKGSQWFSLAADDPLAEALCDWRDRYTQCNEDRRTQTRKVRKTLDTWRYFDDANKAWPEASRFIVERWQTRPDYAGQNLPAIQLKDLNAALDLPPVA